MHKLLFFIGAVLLTMSMLQPGQAARHLELTYVSPSPGAPHVSTGTAIAFRHGDRLDPLSARAARVSVVGSKSGEHSGSLRLSVDGRTLLFHPDRPFAAGETVRVNLQSGLRTTAGAGIAGISYQFSTLKQTVSVMPEPDEQWQLMEERAQPAAATQNAPTYITHPEWVNITPVEVISPAQNAADGYVAFAGLGFASRPTLLMVDNSGEPVYIQQVNDGFTAGDFKRQDVGGIPHLTYHTGRLQPGWTYGVAYALDENYDVVDMWTIGNEYGADLHDFQLLPNGNALLLSYTLVPYDLSPYGGPQNGTVIDIIIQEQDPAKNVIFEWRGLEHIALTDTIDPLNARLVDFMHTNALELDHDGNLMISSRNIEEITKIDRNTGQIIWRMGGKHNQFTFTNDGGFSVQHDIRRLPNGNITIFDNGTSHDPPRSRVVEYAIDEQTLTLTRVWQYPEDNSIYAPFMGNGQRIPNGNTMISWGRLSLVTEVTRDGEKALELKLGEDRTYRAFRFEWDSQPSAQPRLAAMPTANPHELRLYFSWNGATEIEAYELYAGPNRDSLAFVTSVQRTGFETSALVDLNTLGSDTCVFRMRPVHSTGAEMPFSQYAYRLNRAECRTLLQHTYHLPVTPRN